MAKFPMFVGLIALVAGVFTPHAGASLDEPVSIIEAARLSAERRADERSTQRALDAIKALSVTDIEQSWSRVLAIVEDPAFDERIRSGIMMAAMDHCSPKATKSVLASFSTWLESDPKDATTPLARNRLSFWQVIERCADPAWPGWQHAPLEAFAFLEKVIFSDRELVMLQARMAAIGPMIAWPVGDDLKRRTTLRIIADPRPELGLPDRYSKSIDASCFAEIRSVYNNATSLDARARAGTVLAELGDEGFLPTIAAERLDLQTRVVEPYANTPQGVRNSLDQLDNYEFLIKTQHPVASLVSFIGSQQRAQDEWLRLWAMQRALDLGIPPGEIREALMKFEKDLPDVERPRGKGKARPTILIGLKAVAVRLGVLRKSDWPNVPEPFRGIQ